MNCSAKFLIALLLSLASVTTFAQVQDVRVETYYVSDQNDATDTTGGFLEQGSVTYRIYIDLAPGNRLKSIYGDANHPLMISSNQPFFNNVVDGQSFGKNFSLNRLSENTVALDSWLTIGLVTKPSAKFNGVPKNADESGSLIGGTNNDGGSAGILGGLLTNNDPLAGIPLTISDGNDTLTQPTGNWFDFGILSSNGNDSTIFGSISSCSVFNSTGCALQYSSGISGVNPDSNLVLVAQLTTKGSLEFLLNIEVIGTNGNVTKYVSSDSLLQPGEVYFRKLRFPYIPVCGCANANYMEYNPDRDCDSQDSCHTLIVFGCMDPDACNYDPSANINLPNMCCYPGKCNDRDLSVVCPELEANKNNTKDDIILSPVPAGDMIKVALPQLTSGYDCLLYDSYGRKVKEIHQNGIQQHLDIDLTGLSRGIYFVRIINSDVNITKSFIKD